MYKEIVWYPDLDTVGYVTTFRLEGEGLTADLEDKVRQGGSPKSRDLPFSGGTWPHFRDLGADC